MEPRQVNFLVQGVSGAIAVAAAVLVWLFFLRSAFNPFVCSRRHAQSIRPNKTVVETRISTSASTSKPIEASTILTTPVFEPIESNKSFEVKTELATGEQGKGQYYIVSVRHSPRIRATPRLSGLALPLDRLGRKKQGSLSGESDDGSSDGAGVRPEAEAAQPRSLRRGVHVGEDSAGHETSQGGGSVLQPSPENRPSLLRPVAARVSDAEGAAPVARDTDEDFAGWRVTYTR